MKKKTALLLLLLFIISGSHVTAQPKKNLIDVNEVSYDVILVAGQSKNDFGYQLTKTADTISSRVYTLNKSDFRIVPAKTALDFWKATNNIDFATTFSNLYVNDILKNSKRKVLIIPCSYTETNSSGWSKNQNLYKDAIARVNYILQNIPGSKLAAILWHQDETNAGWPNYQKTLDNMIADIRSDIDQKNIQKTPFILGIGANWANTSGSARAQQEIIRKTPDRILNTGFANSDFSTINPIPNNFETAAQKEMGSKYYDEFLKMNGYIGNKAQFTNKSGISKAAVEIQNVLIYPNPSTDNIFVSASSNIKNLVIYDQSKQLVFQNQYDEKEITVSVNHFKTGIYIVVVTLENNVSKQLKIIKK